MDIKWYRVSVLVNVIFFFVIISMGYFLWFKEDPAPYDKDLIEAQKKQLHMENTILLHSINLKSDKIKELERIKDSLSSVPEKIIKPKYEKIYKKVDAYTVSQLTHELDSAFANYNSRD